MSINKNLHLIWRAGFGPMPEAFSDLENLTPNQLFDKLLKASNGIHKKISIESLIDDDDDDKMMKHNANEKVGESKKQLFQKNRLGIRELNQQWLQQMVVSSQQLKEKMSLFWHDHFACRQLRSYPMEQYLDIIRKNALGNFGTLLREVSKSAAMLQFLNNQQNKKSSPNENFAREVMELFTLGRGNYTEQDIKEAARAFTGWGYNTKSEFVFRRIIHDAGNKTILGQTKNFDGDDVIDLLLKQKQTAYYIVEKIYAWFVNEKIDKNIVQKLAQNFYNNNYEIQPLLKEIFTSNWFYSEKNIGNKIKSPVDLIVGIQRLLPINSLPFGFVQQTQRALGQVLLFPPNVAGWPSGKAWIDSSTLLLRMKLPLTLVRKDALNVQLKDDDDIMGGNNSNDSIFDFSQETSIDWQPLMNYFANTKREQLFLKIEELVLLKKIPNSKTLVEKFNDSSTKEQYIKTTITQLMATVEYQLC